MTQLRFMLVCGAFSLCAYGTQNEPHREASMLEWIELVRAGEPLRAPSLERLASFEPKDLESWELENAEIVRVTTGRRPYAELKLTGEGGWTLPGTFQADELGHVILHLASKRRFETSVAAVSDGETLERVKIRIRPRGKPRTVTFTFTHLKRHQGRQVRITVRTKARDTVRLYSASIVATPLSRVVPRRCIDGYDLVRIGNEPWRATCLGTGHPMEAACTPAVDQVLEFSYGIPEVARTGRKVTLVLELSDASGTSERILLPFEEEIEMPARWRASQVPMKRFADQEVTMRLLLETDDGSEAICALTQPMLVKRAAGSPTVLLVTSDTHRGDHLGVSPRSVGVRTPALDALAKQGVYFEDAFASINNTAPSHVALFTGMSPRDTGVVYNGEALAEEATTLADAFRAAGYVTLASVSASPVTHAYCGLGHGFDRYSDDGMDSPDGQLYQRAAPETIDDLRRWLADYEGVPVFLWLHVYDVHGPYTPPAELKRLYYPEDRDPFDADAPYADPTFAPNWNSRIMDPAYTVALYGSEVTWLDGVLGEFFDEPRIRDGIIAVTADHGETFAHGEFPFSHSGLRPSNLYVPLILKAPGLPAGSRAKRPVLQIDLGRTLLDLAGLTDTSFPGENLLTEVDETTDIPRFALHSNGLGASVQIGKGMLNMVLKVRREHEDRRDELFHAVGLYDITADPHMEKDLSLEFPRRTATLRMRLIDWLSEASMNPWVRAAEVDMDVLEEQLSALGYSTAGLGESSTKWIDPDCECTNCRRFRD